MTPEQVAKRKAWTYALFGAGIACLYMAYQYAQPTVGRAEPPPEFAPYLFAGIGIVCFIVAGIMTLKLSKEKTPAATVDLSGPQGKPVIVLLVSGGIALIGLTAVNFLAPEGDPVWLSASVILMLIVAGCFIGAGRIAKKTSKASTMGATKE